MARYTDEEYEAMEAEHADDVQRARRQLEKAVQSALGEVLTAIVVLRELTAESNLWDVDLAEGDYGRDAHAELETAARALRNVGRIIREVK